MLQNVEIERLDYLIEFPDDNFKRHMEISADFTNTNQGMHNIYQASMREFIVIIIFELIFQGILEESNEIAVGE